MSGTDGRERSSDLEKPADDPDDLVDIDELRSRHLGALKFFPTTEARLEFLVPDHPPGVYQRVAEIAGDYAVDIALEFQKYLAAKGVQERSTNIKKKIARAVAAIRELQSLNLDSIDLELAQIDRKQFEALPRVGMFAGVNRLADLLESSPLLNRSRGHPTKHVDRSFVASVARLLVSAGVRVTSTPGGVLDEILCLLLEVDSVSGRLLRHAARAAKSTASE